MTNDAGEAMNEALKALDSLREKVEKTGDDTENIKNTINSLRNDVETQKSNENKYIKGTKGVVDVAKSIVANYDKFTSGDASGAIDLIGTIGDILGGPYGPLIASVCGLIGSILTLFGVKKDPMSKVVEKVIKEALADFKDEAIYEQIIGAWKGMTVQISHLNGIASHNSGHVSDAEKSLLTDHQFWSTLGNRTLGVLQGQIEKYKSINNDKMKSQRIAKYIYFYCMVSVQRAVIMNLYCSLLRINHMESKFAAVSNYLYKDLPTENRKVLEFVSTLPSSGDWWMVYRCLHTTLSAPQRAVISAYTQQIGCPPMEGKLCCIYNKRQKEYMYLPQNNFAYDSDRRRVFTWRPKTCSAQMLFRVIGSDDNCQIFGVFFSEYLYAADYAPFDGDRRRVFSWRRGYPVPQGNWNISGDTIRNLKQNEYMYAADYKPYNENRRRVFTWRPGNPVLVWKIKPVSFEKNDLNKAF